MPPLRECTDKVIAILCADIHLSPHPPRARRDEDKYKGWYWAMKKPLNDLAKLSNHYDAPILCAGDIFDHWKAEPVLVNFALQYLPEMYAVPGQHDLPLHNIELIEKSAFWTMCLADRIIPVITDEPVMVKNDIVLHGFPWGKKLSPVEKPIKGKHHVAIVHDYFWRKGHTHPKAPKSHHMNQYKELAEGYHAVVFGDNHKGFKTNLNGVPTWNCGTLMRRKQDEKEYMPRIGLLCESGQILTHNVSTKNERFTSTNDDFNVGVLRKSTEDLADLMHGLKEAQAREFDYAEAVEFLMTRYSVKNPVRKHLMEALDRG